MSNSLLINAAELLRRPGSERRLTLEPTVAELGIVDPKFDPSSTVEVSLRLESLTDGIVVDGQLRAPWSDSCRRCLAPASGDVVCEVHELYQHVVVDPDAFEIVGDQIDLARAFISETRFSEQGFRLLTWRAPETRQINYLARLLTEDSAARR